MQSVTPKNLKSIAGWRPQTATVLVFGDLVIFMAGHLAFNVPVCELPL